MKVNHVLVGGSGFIARHLREHLVGTILILDKNVPFNLKHNEYFHKLDIKNKIYNLEPYAFEKDTVIHHLAAVHFDFQTDFYETNVEGTKNVIEVFSKCRKWIFYSSVATYGDSALTRDESSSQEPTNDYGKSKLLMEQAIFEKIDSGLLSGQIVIVRPGVVYGEWNFGNVFNLMWLSSRFLPVGLSTNSVKSMAYVKNLVSSTLFALEKAEDGTPLVYNYVDYDQLGTKDLLQLIAIAKESKPLFIPFRFVLGISHLLNLPFKLVGKDFLASPIRVRKFAQPTHFKADKIRNIGFVQPIMPEEAVKRTINWIGSKDVKALRADWKALFKD
ncbi:NAD(P)-dependent oxidoreductase [Schleiferiaceae bacterium]|nr:NAD(P)-dependent oxidoreductase [Schleiferiaceae bacterium]